MRKIIPHHLIKKARELSLQAKAAQDLADDLKDKEAQLIEEFQDRIGGGDSTDDPRLDCEIYYNHGLRLPPKPFSQFLI